jgi:lauroyl/myristoyl acyltransferase
MIFLNFSQLPESVFRPNFPLTGKCFPLTNFSNDKQTQKSLESGFPETTFRETNMA